MTDQELTFDQLQTIAGAISGATTDYGQLTLNQPIKKTLQLQMNDHTVHLQIRLPGVPITQKPCVPGVSWVLR